MHQSWNLPVVIASPTAGGDALIFLQATKKLELLSVDLGCLLSGGAQKHLHWTVARHASGTLVTGSLGGTDVSSAIVSAENNPSSTGGNSLGTTMTRALTKAAAAGVPSPTTIARYCASEGEGLRKNFIPESRMYVDPDDALLISLVNLPTGTVDIVGVLSFAIVG